MIGYGQPNLRTQAGRIPLRLSSCDLQLMKETEGSNTMKSKTPTIIAITALVVAVLAATPVGQAAGRLALGKSSVGTAQLKKNAVTSVKVKNHSLLAADFKAGQLPSGPQGPKGDTGPQGPRGIMGTVQRYAPVESVPANSMATSTAWCNAGEIATGGGGVTYDGSGNVYLLTSAPAPGAVNGTAFGGWGVEVRNTSGSAHDFHAYVVCAS